MSPKELNYIEDALGHEQFLMNQCQEATQNLQNMEFGEAQLSFNAEEYYD